MHPSLMFPTDVKLNQIKSRAYESLYSVSAFRKSNMELLIDIRTLDDSLEKWRLGIPKILRPSLLFSRDERMEVGGINIRSLVLRLDYLHCMTVVHQASNRCLRGSMNSDGTRTVIATGIALAVEASRSSLKYLETAYHILNKGSFWIVLFYPFVASVTILCNILEDPALPSAINDYELLRNFPRLMRDMSTYDLEAEDLLQRDQLEAFVKQMIDVAACAITSVGGKISSSNNE
ncbi:hypothetical protein N7495_003244 [Penicillium taxi]|uniref:uncharacterized protein n=1 Tax=Penicillium taxi TaxID=168475 RepID=UPI00254539FB|nr:uncharacterized protein N7495_003244 [Penicillium taxi]KAJ5902716.1 hypothetical protein N7495_003244 [Penicillium taxi]